MPTAKLITATTSARNTVITGLPFRGDVARRVGASLGSANCRAAGRYYEENGQWAIAPAQSYSWGLLRSFGGRKVDRLRGA